MKNERKSTALDPVVGAAGEQSTETNSNEIIAKTDAGFNSEIIEKPAPSEAVKADPGLPYTIQEELLDDRDRWSYGELKTLSMSEIYESVYPPRRPVIEGLLYSGTYLFVGAPKIGKSFFMAQLAYHVAKGLPLWKYPVRQGTVLYLALEDDFPRIQQRMSRMFDIDGCDALHFATESRTLKEGLDLQLEKFMKKHPETCLIGRRSARSAESSTVIPVIMRT